MKRRYWRFGALGNASHGFTPDVIEWQLAHADNNEARAAYNHARYQPERRKVVQSWADNSEPAGV